MAFVTSPRLPVDPNGNPLTAALSAVSAAQAPAPVPTSQPAQAAPSADATSQMAPAASQSPFGNVQRPNPFSPGSLFWLLSGGSSAPTDLEYRLNLLQAQQNQQGQARAQAFGTLSDLVSQGLSPQKAILQFMKTPQGINFITKDPNVTEAIGQFMKLATVDPKLAARQAAFGGSQQPPAGDTQAPAQSSQGPGIDIFTGQPQAPSAQQPGIAAPVQPQGAGQPAASLNYGGQQIPLQSHQTGDWFRQRAQQLMAVGDEEGARVALDMAKQYDDQLGKVDEYDKYAAQEQAAGRTPLSRFDYKIQTSRAAASQNNINTVEGTDAAQKKALIQADTETLKQQQQQTVKAQQSLQTLSEVEKVINTPGGIAGQANAQLAKLGDLFGFKVSQNMSDAEALQALTASLQAAFRPIGTGSTSDYEQRLFQSAVPGLASSVEGRKKILEINKRIAQRQIQMTDFMRKNLGDPELNTKLADFVNQPVLTPDEMKQFSAAQPQQAQPQGGPLRVPEAGTVDSGYKFNGGDPSDPKNWTKVQ